MLCSWRRPPSAAFARDARMPERHQAAAVPTPGARASAASITDHTTQPPARACARGGPAGRQAVAMDPG